MAIKYTWKIDELKRDPKTGVVKIAYWGCLGVDEETENSVHMNGNHALLSNDPNNPTFIPFENLTQEQVLNWVWQVLNKDKMESYIAQQIDTKNNPPLVPGVPW